ncbi:Kinase-like protein [Mycena venus]|uniref:Kinase-like protein n=1 Tax=Mycena venus TaxID=2733690 RepID=A0A8H6U006_9AGAR|nr:Kinase-like protein [Mycena venus]
MSMASPRILIYQSLFSLIQDVSLATGNRILSTMGAYHENMSADHSIWAIVKSHDSRKTLLKLATELGIYGDVKLRKALREDEERMAQALVTIVNSESDREAVLRLDGDAAQHFLDAVQNTLDQGFFPERKHNPKARRLILKLSEACDRLPSSLFITGVTGRAEHATFGGGFGDIYQATYDGKAVALKHIRTFHRDAEQRRIRLQFCREALVWQHLQHRFILPLAGIDRETFPSSLCMVSPWMKHGTVIKYLKDHGRENVDKLLSEIAQGLQYLHSQNIVHGDLRGANILITDDWSPCLADFGLTSLSDATTATHTSHRAGSIRWMAPELIDPDRFGVKFARTPSTDIYAFGCVCLELYAGRPPFANLSETATLLRVINGDRPARPSSEPEMSEALWQHVNQFWAQDAATRPTTEAVVRHMGLNYVSWLATQFPTTSAGVSTVEFPTTSTDISTVEPEESSLPGTSPPTLTPSPNPRWYYQDPKNSIHGPWKESLMQAWYRDGLLPPDLPVRREEDTEYMLLKDLRLQSVDPTYPFRVPPPPAQPSLQ